MYLLKSVSLARLVMSWPDMSAKRARAAPVIRELSTPAPVIVRKRWEDALPPAIVDLIGKFLVDPHRGAFLSKCGRRGLAKYLGKRCLLRRNPANFYEHLARYGWSIDEHNWRYISRLVRPC